MLSIVLQVAPRQGNREIYLFDKTVPYSTELLIEQ